jgi:hypothetical protein
MRQSDILIPLNSPSFDPLTTTAPTFEFTCCCFDCAVRPKASSEWMYGDPGSTITAGTMDLKLATIIGKPAKGMTL